MRAASYSNTWPTTQIVEVGAVGQPLARAQRHQIVGLRGREIRAVDREQRLSAADRLAGGFFVAGRRRSCIIGAGTAASDAT